MSVILFCYLLFLSIALASHWFTFNLLTIPLHYTQKYDVHEYIFKIEAVKSIGDYPLALANVCAEYFRKLLTLVGIGGTPTHRNCNWSLRYRNCIYIKCVCWIFNSLLLKTFDANKTTDEHAISNNNKNMCIKIESHAAMMTDRIVMQTKPTQIYEQIIDCSVCTCAQWYRWPDHE